jgi:hypothetical protein
LLHLTNFLSHASHFGKVPRLVSGWDVCAKPSPLRPTHLVFCFDDRFGIDERPDGLVPFQCSHVQGRFPVLPHQGSPARVINPKRAPVALNHLAVGHMPIAARPVATKATANVPHGTGAQSAAMDIEMQKSKKKRD